MSFWDFFKGQTPSEKAVRTFNHWVNSRDVIYMDTETTGFSKTSEVIEIAILDHKGQPILNQRIMPKGRIPQEATKVHGISRKDLKNEPVWGDVHDSVMELLKDKIIIAYNAGYDIRLLEQTANKVGRSIPTINSDCAMLAYAQYRAIPTYWGDGWKWHKLTSAIKDENIEITAAHTALGDCLMTYRLVKKIGNQ